MTYKSVEEKANLLFAGIPRPTAENAAMLNRFINARYREFFERFFWPELTLVEKRTFRPLYDSASTYVAKQEVYYPGTQQYYVALRSVPTSTPPVTGTGGHYETDLNYWADALVEYSAADWSASLAYVQGDQVYSPTLGLYYQGHAAGSYSAPPASTWWGELVEFRRFVDYTGGNQGASATALGEVKAVWTRHPYVHEDACPIAFNLTSDGLVVRGTAAELWVEFRRRPNDFTGATWASGSFAVGAQVYYTTTGEYYICRASATTEAPTDTAKWTKLDFPSVLKDAVAQAAFADLLKTTGQTSKWGAEMREAGRLLQHEFDKIERMQGQSTPLNVMTR